MHRAAQASFTAMHQLGYDLSILRGRHYAKMGYERAWNYVTYRFKSEDFPISDSVPDYQPLCLQDVPDMDALYNQAHAAFSGTAVRPTFSNKHPEDICAFGWRKADGSLAGYVRAAPAEEEPKTLLCLEAAGDPGQALAVLVALFRQGAYEKLACFTLPHAHPLLQLLRLGNCIVENRYFEVSGWRVRLINLHGALQKFIPLLEQRLVQSQFADWAGDLLLDAGEQSAVLHIAAGKVGLGGSANAAHTIRGGPAVARLLIGSDEPDEVMRQAGMVCAGVAQPLVQVLFPNLHPMLSQWDEY